MRNSDLYLKYLENEGFRSSRIPKPLESGFFRHGYHVALLPYLRAYWPKLNRPTWQSETWTAVSPGLPGFTRFLHAGQALALLQHYTATRAKFLEALHYVMDPEVWLVAIDWPLELRHQILDRRVETIRVSFDDLSSVLRWERDPFLLPDRLRPATEAGLDRVNTPENSKAGLIRYLGIGWGIGEKGALAELTETAVRRWSPSTASIPFRTSNAPRRLMLGASLLAHAVPLASGLDSRNVKIGRETPVVHPPGCILHACFSLMDGWTHEDAVVISESAAHKLKSNKVFIYRVAIPRHVSSHDLLVKSGDNVERGQPLVRGRVDLFALGCSYLEAGKLEARYIDGPERELRSHSPTGYLDVELPHSTAPEQAKVVSVVERPCEENNAQLRTVVEIELHASAVARVGDKLATWHGVKGVVSRVVPDEAMPLAGNSGAEIVFNPAGIFRRSAMGQFREAAGTEEAPENVPGFGPLFVMRQPHDSAVRWSARGGRGSSGRGQRYGWMELLSLLSHGADTIACELLSYRRTAAPWMAMECAILKFSDARLAATNALNRYLQFVGCRIKGRELIFPKHEGYHLIAGAFSEDLAKGFVARSGSRRDLNEIEEHLEDEEWWLSHPGGAYIELGTEPVTITDKRWTLKRGTPEDKGKALHLRFRHLPILPPWLRPATEVAPNKLTSSYRRVLRLIANQAAWKESGTAWLWCVRRALGSPLGLQEFVRAEILGRRLTRSARAVITPDPTLRPDQIRIPKRIFDVIFEDLPKRNREFVLFARNPTLQRRGLLALRPVEPSDTDVLQVPLGILSVMGADFDGDQALIVALEDDASIEDARKLAPGSVEDLRRDPFRLNNAPAFPLVNELSDLPRESSLAAGKEDTADKWCDSYLRMQRAIIEDTADGWRKIPRARAELLKSDAASMSTEKRKHQGRLYEGLAESNWFALAVEQMAIIYSSVRKKGALGGVLRREYYHRAFHDLEQFRECIEACQTVTERMTQQALSVKSGAGTKGFPFGKFFKNPRKQAVAFAKLEDADSKFPLRKDRIVELLAERVEPQGLLALLYNPRPENLLELAWNAQIGSSRPDDPRIDWFLR